MTVATHLTNLASSLVLSADEKTSISTSIGTMASRLSSYFGADVLSRFQFGSSVCSTILPRIADQNSAIDYMVVFNASVTKQKPQTYLCRLRRFAEDKYATSQIKQSHPTLVLSLNHIHFDLVPAIHDCGYQFPSPALSYGDWMPTDPHATNQSLQEKNKSENYQIKPLVRLIKYWNATKGHPYSSFYLECYIVNKFFFYLITLKEYFYTFWEEFSYNVSTPQDIKNYVDSAKKHAANAKGYDRNDMTANAEAEMKRIVPAI